MFASNNKLYVDVFREGTNLYYEFERKKEEHLWDGKD
jgi:hypothetical protein